MIIPTRVKVQCPAVDVISNINNDWRCSYSPQNDEKSEKV